MSEDNEKRPRTRLFTIAKRTSESKLPNLLKMWNTTNFTLMKSVACVYLLSSLATSPCGKFVATGSKSGFVDIFKSHNLQVLVDIPFTVVFFLIHKFICLQKVKHVEAHTNFITGLAFVPCNTLVGQEITGKSKAAVISISLDRSVIHCDDQVVLGIHTYLTKLF